MKTLKWMVAPVLAIGMLASCNNTNDGTAMDDNGMDNDPTVVDNDRNDRDGMFSDWDADRNDGISRNEFDEAFDDESFDRWDKNHDGIIDDNEYGDGLFDRADRDGSGMLSENERNTIWDDKPGADIADWDLDGNKEVDREEFRQIFTMKTDFKDWDDNGDGKLDKTEYTNRMYRRMDNDNDGTISRGEFDQDELMWPRNMSN